MTAPAPSRLDVVRLSDVVPEAVSWLWPGRLPAGKLVTLDGDPGLGKSTLALAFAAVVTTGGEWPDGTSCAFPGDVVLLAAEDGLADTVRPRLDAAGADVTRVHAVQGVRLVDPDTGETFLRPPTLGDVDALLDLVRATGARLLVVDVLMAYLPSGTDSHRDQDVRRVLSGLASLADATGCAVLLLRHLNKSKGGDPMYRGGGSIGIVGAARAGMLVARDPDDDDARVLASTKSNLGAPPTALRYRLTDANSHGVARVEWLGDSPHDARALLADNDDPDDDDRSAADTWLRDLLEASGLTVPAADMPRHARAAGFSIDQAKRAKRRLGVLSVKGASSWVWRLPDPEAPRTRPLAPLPSSQVSGSANAPEQGKSARAQPGGPLGAPRCEGPGCGRMTDDRRPDRRGLLLCAACAPDLHLGLAAR